MAEKPSQRIATVSNKIIVQQYMCVCLYASGNYRVREGGHLKLEGVI